MLVGFPYEIIEVIDEHKYSVAIKIKQGLLFLCDLTEVVIIMTNDSH